MAGQNSGHFPDFVADLYQFCLHAIPAFPHIQKEDAPAAVSLQQLKDTCSSLSSP